MSLSKKISGISPSPTLAISAKAKKLKSEGLDILEFGTGEPDFDTPNHIKAAAIAAINEGFTKYTASGGIPALRSAVAKKLKNDNGLDYKPSEIVISCGAKHSLFNTMIALFQEGDEVIIPSPYWVTYPEQVKLAGAAPVILGTYEKDNFCLDPQILASHITPKTKGIIINSPNNPCGTIYSLETLKAIAKLAVEKNIWIISDECYEKLIYDGKHYSIAALGNDIKEKTIIINAVSKAYSMTGWRIGYAAGPQNIMTAMDDLQSQCTSNPCSIAQKAALAALEGPQEIILEWREEFDTRRQMMVEGLNKIPGFSCLAPQGAFYVFPNWSKLRGYKTPDGKVLKTSSDLTEYLLTFAQVALVQGEAFGADDYLRLSYATSQEIIQKGLIRIADAIGKLTKA